MLSTTGFNKEVVCLGSTGDISEMSQNLRKLSSLATIVESMAMYLKNAQRGISANALTVDPSDTLALDV